LAAQAAASSRLSSLSLSSIFLLIEDGFQRVITEVAAVDEPFVVLLDHDVGREADQCAVVGEDADDVGAGVGCENSVHAMESFFLCRRSLGLTPHADDAKTERLTVASP
jgi:hypothetical protein